MDTTIRFDLWNFRRHSTDVCCVRCGFSSFHSHALEKVLRGRDDENVHLFRAVGLRWRRPRQVINPTFSTAKLKLMSSLMNEYIEAMLSLCIRYERFLPFRIANLMPFLGRPIYYLLFGLINVRKALMKLLPFLSNYIQEIPILWLLNNVQKVVDIRIESSATNSVKRIDLLQLMMDASISEKITVRIIIHFYQIFLIN